MIHPNSNGNLFLLKNFFLPVILCFTGCVEPDKLDLSGNVMSQLAATSPTTPGRSGPQVSIVLSSNDVLQGRSLAIDSKGNIYFDDHAKNVIHKLTRSGGLSIFYQGTAPYLLTIDPSDNLYTAPWGG